MNRIESKRAMAVVAGLLVATGLATAAGAQQAVPPPADPPAFHARRLGEAKSPPATLESMAWLAGRWTGEGLGGVSEEIWSPPAGGAMIGTYRLLKVGKPLFYEFLLLVEENGSLNLKLKHFNPDLTGYVTNRATNALFDLIGKEK